jgi:four helix bundle protein
LRRKYRDLRVWQAAVELVETVYQITAAFPREEAFGLTSQMRRAAISVPANIAEGAARAGTKELLRFLSIASGSLSRNSTHTSRLQ